MNEAFNISYFNQRTYDRQHNSKPFAGQFADAFSPRRGDGSLLSCVHPNMGTSGNNWRNFPVAGTSGVGLKLADEERKRIAGRDDSGAAYSARSAREAVFRRQNPSLQVSGSPCRSTWFSFPSPNSPLRGPALLKDAQAADLHSARGTSG